MLILSHPWMFLLVPLPWILVKLVPQPPVPSLAVRVPFGKRIKSASSGGGGVEQITRRWGKLIATGLVWLLIVTALAKPQWLEPPIEKTVPTRDLLLLVDLSGSMDHEDFVDKEGMKTDRLTAVKQVVGDFLIHRQGDRVGLVVFGSAPFLQAPFSTDLKLVRSLLDETSVGMAGPRTALGDAIGLGINLFENSDAPVETIIALTDGNDTASQVPPVEAARVAKERDIRIHTVAIGDPQTVGEEKLDEQTLRDVATTAGGKYFFAADREALSHIYDELDKIETRKISEVSHRPRRDLYYWPLLAALLFSLVAKGLQLINRAKLAAPIAKNKLVRVDPLSGKLEVVT
ncbi:VWA domain-containing protein [Bythopirellula goksoeyrii]|uniref:von Willebrand factor type A domain protein n=1 Tax=Bythopirellula goksoeyrii TaxID=1400387 RepID=A0A5B9QM78_9BACT|nr:VWA domain-containing protein [Bythopirellula goksoeyrii]QEG35221.1 von Willebrand factor type A domain protein [Bythopirellula goksoeyrii]